jgi:diaminohydroxyphosphoribosylaminopyrimidine deaminase/5-amino-6-(5-phosphoribosylamino)uracil reductase
MATRDILDARFMQEALHLAKKGWGRTGINPFVGAVIVRDGKVVGRGYHRKLGEAHAETCALIEAGSRAAGATLYVNLEPCCCTGRTPPCVESIHRARLARVVIGMTDPNPAVNGRGVKFLRENGIEVVTGLLEDQCAELNLWYARLITLKVPYVVVKVAASRDGRITGFSEKYITSERSRRYVHSLRGQVSGVLVGINTVLTDDPLLTDRMVGRSNPTRIVLDPHLRVPLDARFLNADARRIIFTGEKADAEKAGCLKKMGAECVFMKGDRFPLEDVLEKLGAIEIGSVLVEGGGIVFSQFLQKKMWDELYVFMAEKTVGKGVDFLQESSLAAILSGREKTSIGEDTLYHVYGNN